MSDVALVDVLGVLPRSWHLFLWKAPLCRWAKTSFRCSKHAAFDLEKGQHCFSFGFPRSEGIHRVFVLLL